MSLIISGDTPNFTSASATTITGVTTLNGSSGVLATQNGMTGIAKAWVSFVGASTPTIYGSFNVSSVTYNATADYTINLTTAASNANYAVFGNCSGINSSRQGTVTINTVYSSGAAQAPTTTAFRICTVNYGNTGSDTTYVSVAILGN